MGVETVVISFLGHSSLYNCNDLFERVKKGITENISVDDNVVFLCGGYGDFDDLCARVCRLIKEERENCEIVFVTPYIVVMDCSNCRTPLFARMQN